MLELKSLLQEFARRQGMEQPLPDEQGRFEIVFDPDASVRCFVWFEDLHLCSPLAMPPEQPVQRREWFKRLMNYSLHRMKDSRSTPALAGDGSVTLYARLKLAGMSIADFEAEIEQQLNSVENYRKVLGTAETAVSLETLPRSIVRP